MNESFFAYFCFAAFNPSSNVFHSMVSPHPIKFESKKVEDIKVKRNCFQVFGLIVWNPVPTSIKGFLGLEFTKYRNN